MVVGKVLVLEAAIAERVISDCRVKKHKVMTGCVCFTYVFIPRLSMNCTNNRRSILTPPLR